MSTRLDDYLCKPSDGITGSKLPSHRQVLSFFFYHHISKKNTIKDSATTVVNELSIFWKKAKIPIICKDIAIAKGEKLYKHYQSLKKESKKDLFHKNNVILLQNFLIYLI